jgi:hypothetical protein
MSACGVERHNARSHTYYTRVLHTRPHTQGQCVITPGTVVILAVKVLQTTASGERLKRRNVDYRSWTPTYVQNAQPLKRPERTWQRA